MIRILARIAADIVFPFVAVAVLACYGWLALTGRQRSAEQWFSKKV